MTSPLVSVVIPAYNAAKTLDLTIRTVLDQTVQDFEVIVVDDGSGDETTKVAEAIGDQRIRTIAQPNGGASKARNTGIEAAQGRYIALLDADDLWMPEKLERQLEIFEADPTVDAVKTSAYFVDGELRILSTERVSTAKDVLLETLLFRNLPAVMSTIMLRREVFDRVGIFLTDLVILEDWEFLVRLARFAKIRDLDEPLALYRVYPGNRSKDLAIHIEPGFIALERLFCDPELPDRIRSKRDLVYSAFYSMLAGAAFNLGQYNESLRWGLLSVGKDLRRLGYISAMPIRKLARRRSRQPPDSFFKAIERFRGLEGRMQ